MRSPRSLALLAGLTLVVAPLAACGDDDSDVGTAATAAPAATATTAPAAESRATTAAPATTSAPATTQASGGDYGYGGGGSGTAAPGAAVSVGTADSEYGTILVDGGGRTLYLFTRDSGGASACTGPCAEAWPPLVAEGSATAASGVDDSKLGTITRDDGTTQVTFGGHPLYHFASDVSPGDVTGQGVGGNWFVVAPDGTAIQG